MFLFETVNSLQDYILQQKSNHKSIGFVPTMGALHPGHLSLIERSNRENDITICSIFVNPVQFNDKKDLDNYPRDKDGDISLLKQGNCTALFLPSYNEIYPGIVPESINLGSLENILEGAFRPGHFAGVSVVVRRLFDIVKPQKAYFGLKDYQQFLVIKTITEKLELPVQIVGCETKREDGGLAMSSRNRLLSAEGKAAALLFSQSLKKAKNLIERASPETIITEIKNDFAKSALCELQYFEITDAFTLEKVMSVKNHKSVIACIAGYVDRVRLIDNLILIP